MAVPAVKIRKEDGESVIQLMKDADLYDPLHLIGREGSFLLVPLKKQVAADRIEGALKGHVFELTKAELAPRRRKARSVEEILRGKLEPELLRLVPRSYDVLGKVAVIELQDELKPYKSEVAEAIRSFHKQVDTVLMKAGPVETGFRTRRYEVVAGSGKTETAYRENACVFEFDVQKVFFSPRLSGERLRVAGQVDAGEKVVDMFAGVGPYSVLIGRLGRASSVYAVEVNPDAHGYLKRNVELNKVSRIVKPFLGDVRAVFGDEEGFADRVIMNLPHSALEYLDIGSKLLGWSGGTVHFYGLGREPKAVEKVVQAFEAKLREVGRSAEVLYAKKLKEVAPYSWTVSVDAELETI